MAAASGRHPSSFSTWPHRLAVTLAGATFPLLFIGGLVTSLGAGLAVPDWPTTFGYNMFLYPWSKMIGGVFYEHSHRLIASCVGLLTIALTVTLWIKEDRRWLRWLGITALAMVIVQGVLGGLRVVLLQHTLAIIHACFAQVFFALTVSLALFTSREWCNENSTSIDDGGRLRRLALITTVLVYIQIVFGALLRHTGERLDGHLLFAALVAIHVVLLLLRITRHHGEEPTLVRPAYWLGGLLLVQLSLGTAAYLGKFTPLLPLRGGALVLTATTHLIIGALMLVTSLTIALRAFRHSRRRESHQGRALLTEQYSA
ncbi:MAG TPA: COX15/CtaA family protein [Candidatus Binatia bacterium]|nr:COX15/CtaA family protein [Candidatus Binatia bacterium]